jgi:hypothetical protein
MSRESQAPRKSRLKRLHVSGGVGASPIWNLSDDGWRRIENDTGLKRGTKFNAEFRRSVQAAAEKYLTWQPFERSAPVTNDFIEKATKARRLARDLADIIESLDDAASLFNSHWNRQIHCGLPQGIEMEDSGPTHVDGNDDEAFLKLIHKNPKSLHERGLAPAVHAIGNIIDDVIFEITGDGESGFKEHDAWSQLILDINEAFKTHTELRATASKDVNRQPSPFVRFVSALQSTFEKEFRLFQTESSLSKEVHIVLKRNGKIGKRDINCRRPRLQNSPNAKK